MSPFPGLFGIKSGEASRGLVEAVCGIGHSSAFFVAESAQSGRDVGIVVQISLSFRASEVDERPDDVPAHSFPASCVASFFMVFSSK